MSLWILSIIVAAVILLAALFFIPWGFWCAWSYDKTIQFKFYVFHERFVFWKWQGDLSLKSFIKPQKDDEEEEAEKPQTAVNVQKTEIPSVPKADVPKIIQTSNSQSPSSNSTLGAPEKQPGFFKKIRVKIQVNLLQFYHIIKEKYLDPFVQRLVKLIKRPKVIIALIWFGLRSAKISLGLWTIKIENVQIHAGFWDAYALSRYTGFFYALKSWFGLKNIEWNPIFGKDHFACEGALFVGLSGFKVTRTLWRIFKIFPLQKLWREYKLTRSHIY